MRSPAVRSLKWFRSFLPGLVVSRMPMQCTHPPTVDDGKRSVAATADTTWSTEKAGRRSAGLGALRFVATKEIDAGVATSGG